MFKSKKNKKPKHYLCKVVLILSFIVFKCHATSVLLVAPQNSKYWDSVYEPMKPVATQLNIELASLRPPKMEGFDFEPSLRKYIHKKGKPDWVVWVPRRSSPKAMLALLEKHQIKSISISNPIANIGDIGAPQQKFKYWKAEITSSNFEATYNMMKTSASHAKTLNRNPPYSLIAIAGNQYLKSAQNVTSAVQTAAEELPLLNLLQLVHTNWSSESAFVKTTKLLQRHNKIIKRNNNNQQVDLLWAGNIDLAIGVVDAVDKFTETQSVKRPLIVSQGWHPDIFSHIETGDIQFSIGGNHINGVWSLVLIYDQEMGVTLNSLSIDSIIQVPKTLASKQNIHQLTAVFETDFWHSANIKQFSKMDNPSIRHYDFDVNRLMAASKPTSQTP